MKNTKGFKWSKSIEVVQLIIDICIVIFAYYTGFRLQRTGYFDTDSFFAAMPQGLYEILFIVGFTSLVIFAFFKTFKLGQTPATLILNVLFSIASIALISIFIDFAIKGLGIWRQTTAVAIAVELVLLLFTKILFLFIYRLLYIAPNTYIISNSLDDASELFLKSITVEKQNYNIKKVIFASMGINKIKEEIETADTIFLTSKCNENIKSELIEFCLENKINCSLVPSIPNITLNSGIVSNIDDILLLDIKTTMDIEYKVIKRISDIIISSICLLLLSPMFLIVMLLIYLEDKHNPFYVQPRLTKNNRVFNMYKFRTMRIDAEKNVGAVISTKNDNRITKTGNILRKFRIDETPQFLNILLGDMSFVGPRPERKELLQEISKEIPEYRYRTVTKAGLTGLAQVSGWYDTSFENKLKFDLYYVNHCSILLDIRIILMTANAVINPSIYDENYAKIKDFESILKILSKHGYCAEKHEHYIEVDEIKKGS